jgi:putative ABC transport system permease protein
MTLKDIALRNLRRRKARAAFVLAGLLIAVSTAVALISLVGAMNHDIQHKLEKYGANILIIPKTENLPLTYGGLALGGVSFEMQEIREADLKMVGSIKNAANVAAVGPMVLGVVKVGNQRVLLAGVDFQAVRVLKPWWTVQGAAPGPDGVILGAEAARILGLTPGAGLNVGRRNLQVSGILAPTGSQDDHLVFTRLGTAQSILGKDGRVSMAEVAALCNACPIEAMVGQISAVIPGAKVMAIQQVVQGRLETLGHFRKFSYGVSGVLVLGFRRGHVIRIVLLEAMILSALAGLLGYLAGFGATKVAFPLLAGSSGAAVMFDPLLGAGAVALALATGLVSSAYPALLAARIDPNEALRAL